MMRIAVTGANGYLGTGIVKRLLDSEAIVVAADIMTDCVDDRAQSISGDIFSVENPYAYLGSPDVLLHLAWKNGFVHDAPIHLQDLYAHYSFIEKMISQGLRQVAVMGTMHEIGFFEGCIDENTPCRPMNLYGISKNALREAVEALSRKTNCVFQWLRGFYIVGNSEHGNSIFSKVTAAEKKGDAEFPFTLGQNQYDFLDYNVFCDQVAAAVTQTKISGIINICSGYPEKLSDRVERFIQQNDFHIRLKYGAFPDREYDSKAIWGNDKKIRQIMRNRNGAAFDEE